MAEPHSISRLRVRYAETDQMGVAYHANYLVWCEIGRTDLIRTIGGPTYAEMEQQGLKLAVAEATLRYIAPARYDDELIVETRLVRAQSRLLTFDYRVLLESPAGAGAAGTLLATATTVLISIDDEGRTRAMPAGLREAIGRFLDSRT